MKFESDLSGRVANLALGPRTPSNSLVPIFEAIYNSIHASEERFGDDWMKEATITVEFLHLDSADCIISDNGVGLTDENFKSFRTYDSRKKIKKGGRGIGRISWLKVFDQVDVTSTYFDGKSFKRREFTFKLDNENTIQEYKEFEGNQSEVGTRVHLRRMKADYYNHMPTKLDTVLRKFLAHFVSYFLGETLPRIEVVSGLDQSWLGDFLKDSCISLAVENFEFQDENISIKHYLIEKSISETNSKHAIFFCAHGRVVFEHEISTPLGIVNLIEKGGKQYRYVGLVEGQLLDESVTIERTSYDIDKRIFEELVKACISKASVALADQIQKLIQKQSELVRGVIKKYPRFSYIVQDPATFARDKLPRNARTVEQIYQQMAVHDFRENRDIEKKIDKLSKMDTVEAENAIQLGTDAIIKRLSSQELAVLADYTVRRKVILDLLEKKIGFRPDGSMKHEAEKALHSFIVPMQKTNHDISVDGHNLWIVDDKLAYYEFWASDKKIKSIINDSDSNSRPDLLLFGGRAAFHRPGTDQPVVIVEFKKPARDDYTDEENPFTQIYSYIEELKDGKILDKDGAVIQEVAATTPYFCYIIADITPKLKKWARMAQINVPLPGGGGIYGYNDEYKAFIQVLSYKYLIKDARLRNEAFFKRLSI